MIGSEKLREMMLYVAEQVVASEEYLTEIDIKIGDGDHGIGMSLGFRGVLKELPEKTLTGAESVFSETGMILLDTMGGASGVLFGTMFISGVIKREMRETIGAKDFAEVFRKSLDALKQRGKARIGDKTMIDALEPAVVGLEEAAAEGASLKAALRKAADNAREGMEYTKQCMARFGRAKYYKEAAIGLQDAGATSVYIIWNSMATWAEANL